VTAAPSPSRSPFDDWAMTGRHGVILAALVLGLGAVVLAWVSVDRRPPEWDHANHLEREVACHRSLSEPAREAWREIIAESTGS
jgi:hypothetical protein